MAGIREDTVVSVLSLSHATGVYVTQYAVENVHVFIQTYNTVIRTKIFMYIHSQPKLFCFGEVVDVMVQKHGASRALLVVFLTKW